MPQRWYLEARYLITLLLIQSHHCDGPSVTARLNSDTARRRLLGTVSLLFLAVTYALSAVA